MKSKLKLARKFRNISQKALAERIGVSHITLSRWERGKYEPPMDKAKSIANILKMSLDDIFLV